MKKGRKESRSLYVKVHLLAHCLSLEFSLETKIRKKNFQKNYMVLQNSPQENEHFVSASVDKL